MTIYNISKDTFRICGQGVMGAVAGAGFGFIGGCLVKPFISGLDHLNCIKIASIFLGVCALFHNPNSETIEIRDLIGIAAGGFCTFVFCKWQAIPFAPWTCVAVVVTIVAMLSFGSLGLNYFELGPQKN